jgi:hypothetical protein
MSNGFLVATRAHDGSGGTTDRRRTDCRGCRVVIQRWLPLLIVLAPPSLALIGVAFVSWTWLVPLVPFTVIAAFGIADWRTGRR